MPELAAEDQGMGHPDRRRGRAWYVLPFGFVLGLVGLLCVGIYWLNDGRFTYTIDDAYIHLALSEQIAQGHYGINDGEAAAPASSIIWPFLLAPFASQSWHEYVPLVLCLLATLGSAALLMTLLARTALSRAPKGPLLIAGFVCTAVVALNMMTVLFTGMEHSLQTSMALVVVLGLAVLLETGRVPWWLVVAIVAGPLVRYEMLALSFGAVVVLLIRRRYGPALLSGGLVVLFMAGFVFFLYVQGLPILPSSVLVHSTVMQQTTGAMETNPGFVGTVLSVLKQLVRNAIDAIYVAEGRLALAMTALVFVHMVWRPRDVLAPFRLFMCIAVGLIFLFGQIDIVLLRYQTYWMVFVTAGFVYSCGPLFTMLATRVPAGATLAFGAALLLSVGIRSVDKTVTIPEAANNIYEQQYQMHRFITEYYNEPVGVNDLGWAAYRNDNYVLDLVGLASERARLARLSGDKGWMNRMTTEHDVALAMVYTGWFPGEVPESWERVGTLHLGGKQKTVALKAVDFYVTDPAERSDILAAMEAFKPTLPERVRFEITGQSPPRKEPEEPRPDPDAEPAPESDPAPAQKPDEESEDTPEPETPEPDEETSPRPTPIPDTPTDPEPGAPQEPI